MSVNLELPTKEGLQQLAPNKNYTNILKPMKQIQMGSGRLISDGKEGYQIVTRTGRKNNSKFVPAGQSTQMIIGATPETGLSAYVSYGDYV